MCVLANLCGGRLLSTPDFYRHRVLARRELRGGKEGIDRPIFQNADGSDFLRENWRRGESIFWVGVPLSFLWLLVVSLWLRKECPCTF